MRYFARIALAAIVCCLCAGTADAAGKLKELRGDHFIVTFDGDETYARNVLHQAERMYVAIARNLGHDQLAKPWRGDYRCKITLLKNPEAFREKTKGMVWAEGMANIKTREIFAFYGAEDFLSSTLPHEITHLVFREIMGHSDNIALWLDEGVALSQEPDRKQELYPVARRAFTAGKFIPFEEMNGIRDGRSLSTQRAAVFYAQALATVNFLMESLRRDRFLKFCRLLRDGQSVEQALKQVYGTERIQTLKDLQKRVQEFVG